MDWGEAIEKERQVLKRIIALFLALAGLTDGIQRLPHPIRCLILWILKRPVIIALDAIADDGPMHPSLIWKRTDSIAEARRYSLCFWAAVRSMERQIEALDRCEASVGMASVGMDGYPILLRRLPQFEALFDNRLNDLLDCLRGLIPIRADMPGRAPMYALFEPELRDTS